MDALRRLRQTIGDGWHRFWFQPTSTATLAIVRIGWGLLVFAWTATLAPDLFAFYGRHGVQPAAPVRDFRYGLFDIVESPVLAVAIIGVLLFSSLCVAFGFRTRVATVVTFVLLLSLWERNPWHYNGGDMLIRHLGFFLMFAPAGAALSVDRWRRGRRSLWGFPQRAPWALRMMQVQVAVLYFFTTWAKARGDRWVDGTAVGDTIRVDDLTRFEVPYWFSESLIVNNMLTWGTLAVELALAILIWNRRWRPWVIAAGIGLHLFVEVSFDLGFFAAAIFVGYLAFIPEDTAARWLGRLRAGVAASRFPRLRALAEPELGSTVRRQPAPKPAPEPVPAAHPTGDTG